MQLFQKGGAWLTGNSLLFVLAEDRWIKTKAKTISLAFTDFILTKRIFFDWSMLIDVIFAPKRMIEFRAYVIPPSLGRTENRPLKTLEVYWTIKLFRTQKSSKNGI